MLYVWYPMFHIPNSSAGISAITTMIIERFISTASRICEPLLVTVLGVKAKVWKASYVLPSQLHLPFGSIFSNQSSSHFIFMR